MGTGGGGDNAFARGAGGPGVRGAATGTGGCRIDRPGSQGPAARPRTPRLGGDAGPDAGVAGRLQRPGIRAAVQQALDILLRLAGTLEDRARWARAVGTAGVARGFAAAIREELDFRVEARNMAAVAAT